MRTNPIVGALLLAFAAAAPAEQSEVAWLRKRVAELEAQASRSDRRLCACPGERRGLEDDSGFAFSFEHSSEASPGATWSSTPHAEEQTVEGEHGAVAGEHDTAAGEHGAAVGEHGAAVGEHGAAAGEHGVAVGEHGAAVGEHGAAVGEHGAAAEHGAGEHAEEHGVTIFKMPEHFDKNFMMMMIALLVIVTIAFEKGSEYLEEIVGEEGIQAVLLQKMFKELTILGFVAFSATMLLQAELLPLTHDQHLNFEFAHVLMFATAIAYAKEIFSVSHMLHGIRERFEQIDEQAPAEVLKTQVERFGHRTAEEPDHLRAWKDLPVKEKLTRAYETLQGVFSSHEQKATFKALKFHFLGFNQLLGTRFRLSEYIEKCTEKRVGAMVDIEPYAWAGLCFVIVIGLVQSWIEAKEDGGVSDRNPAHATAMFIIWGFLLLLGEVLVVVKAKLHLAKMLDDGHHIRTSEEGDRWPEFDEHQAIIESELNVLKLVQHNKSEAAKVNAEMHRAHDMYIHEVEHMEHHNHEKLEQLEQWFQLALLLQAMLRCLILLMHLRNCFILFPWYEGLVVLILMWLPTELMTWFVTPVLLSQLSLAYAIGVKNKKVLEEMMEEATAEGDYSAAGQVLELAMTAKLTEEEIGDEETVRDKVKDLLKLGELKWRYRVVEEGQNPRDEAIKVLDEAQDYVINHIYKVLEREGKAKDEGIVTKHKEEVWADELSECCQGLALARLIFNGNNRDEDPTISDMLNQALKLRETMKDKPKMADTRNSLGALKQKQKKYPGAEKEYKLSLELREALTPTSEKEAAEKQQFLAQSHTSLGNLYLEMEQFPEALASLQSAKECYVKGFNASHPKVAWAVEAQANVYKKMRNFRKAQECIDEAINIRRALQDKGDGKALFSKELEKAESTNKEILESRKSIQDKFKKQGSMALLSGGKGGKGACLLLAAKQAQGAASRPAQCPGAEAKDGAGMGHLNAAPAASPAAVAVSSTKPAVAPAAVATTASSPAPPAGDAPPRMPKPSAAYLERKAKEQKK